MRVRTFKVILGILMNKQRYQPWNLEKQSQRGRMVRERIELMVAGMDKSMHLVFGGIGAFVWIDWDFC